MRPAELRIGNYVKIHESDKTNSIVTIYKIEEDAINGWIFYEPIPLTEEWLLKFRFKRVGDSFYLNGFCVFIDSGNFFYGLRDEGLMDMYIKHVHQLQNLYFALAGEELKYKQ